MRAASYTRITPGRRSTGVGACAVFLAILLVGWLELAQAQSQQLASDNKAHREAATAELTNKLLAENPPPRTIVTTDLEIDDQASFHRYLLYTNDLNTIGLVPTSSRFHHAGGTTADGQTIKAQTWSGNDWLSKLIDGGYKQVYDNLVKHDPRYPTPQHLLSLIKLGNIVDVNEMALKTEGSELIKKALLDDSKPGPIWIQTWGGTNTTARALKSIEEECKDTPQWKEIQEKVSARAIIYIILDQDTTYNSYIAPNWPKLRIIYNQSQFSAVAYRWANATPEPWRAFYQTDWIKANIIQGPLLKSYPNRGGNFISEGDSPSYFHLVPVGLRNLENASYGGWGGRFDQRSTYLWRDTVGRGQAAVNGTAGRTADYNPITKNDDSMYPQTRWTEPLQNDFAGRVAWTTTDSFDKANHPPVAYILPEGRDLEVKAGQTVKLNGLAGDPDGDALAYKWWQYKEAGTFDGAVPIADANTPSTSFVVPENAQVGQTIHIIFEVKDAGTPPLTRYQRVIATVK
jgi:Protein of unknown function (DUF1593)